MNTSHNLPNVFCLRIALLLIALMFAFASALFGCASSTANSSHISSSASSTSHASASENADLSSIASAMGKTDTENGLVRPSVGHKLHVDGSKLCDSYGRTVQLKGICTHGLSWFPSYVNKQMFDELNSQWNANVVRLALYTAENGGYCTGGDKDALMKLIDNGIGYAAESDLYVIVDWHILSDANPLEHVDEAKRFFDDVSRRYAKSEHVLYEICNEPNGATTWDDVVAYANQVIPVIRENNPDSVIIVGTPTWSQDVDKAAKQPLDFDNVMYSLHFYAATHKQDLRNRAEDAIKSGLALFVSEFGICDASGNGAIDEQEAENWIQFLNRNDISYVMWNLSNKDESSAVIKPSCAKDHSFDESDLSQAGIWLMHTLVRNSNSADSASSAMQETSGSDKQPDVDSATPDTANAIHVENDLEIRLTERSSWVSEGEQYRLFDIAIQNNGADASSWEVNLSFSGPVEITDSWNGRFSLDGTNVRISNAEYNGQIAQGSTVSDIGFIAKGTGSLI